MEINGCANHGMLPAVNFQAFNAWIHAIFLLISSFRSIGRIVLNAGVAVLLREISEKMQNLQKLLAGSISGGSAAEA